MSELKKHPIFIVKADDEAAMSAVRKLCENAAPGAVVPLTDKEFKAFMRNVVQLDLSNVR